MARSKLPPENEIPEDLKGLPEEVQRGVIQSRKIEALTPKKVEHYVYRWDDRGRKVAVGKMEGFGVTPPNAFDLGERFRKGGDYEVLTKVYYQDTEGKAQNTTLSSGQLFVSSDFETQPPAAPAASPAAQSSAGELGNMSASIALFKEFAGIVTMLKGDAPKAPEAASFAKLNEQFAAQLASTEEFYTGQIKQLKKNFELRIQELEDGRPQPQGEQKEPEKGFDLGGLAEGAGNVMRIVKEGIELFDRKPAT